MVVHPVAMINRERNCIILHQIVAPLKISCVSFYFVFFKLLHWLLVFSWEPLLHVAAKLGRSSMSPLKGLTTAGLRVWGGRGRVIECNTTSCFLPLISVSTIDKAFLGYTTEK